MAYEIKVKRVYTNDYPNSYAVKHLTEAKAFVAQVMDLAEYATDDLEIVVRKTPDEAEAD